MNKFTLFSGEFRGAAPWMNAMKDREAKKTPTHEMKMRMMAPERVATEQSNVAQAQPIFNRDTQRIEAISAELARVPSQLVVRG